MRKLPFLIVSLALLIFFGCSAKRFVADTLKESSLGLPIDYKQVSASKIWSTGEPGKGLQVSVWCNRDLSDYRPNLDLELDGAVKVCSVLAQNDHLLKWAYLDLIFYNNYQQTPVSSRKLSGNAEVIINRETLKLLREQNAPASEYQKKWRFIQGFKDQRDSKKVLKW